MQDRYSRGAMWEHNGEPLTVLCSDIRLGMAYVHFMGDTLRGALRDEMTEENAAGEDGFVAALELVRKGDVR